MDKRTGRQHLRGELVLQLLELAVSYWYLEPPIP